MPPAIETPARRSRSSTRHVALPPEDVVDDRGDAVEEEDPVEMIDLVLDAARLEAVALDPAPPACSTAIRSSPGRTFAVRSGIDRHPSRPISAPSAATIRGLTSTRRPLWSPRLRVLADVDDDDPDELAESAGPPARRNGPSPSIVAEQITRRRARRPAGCAGAAHLLQPRIRVEQYLPGRGHGGPVAARGLGLEGPDLDLDGRPAGHRPQSGRRARRRRRSGRARPRASSRRAAIRPVPPSCVCRSTMFTPALGQPRC